MRRFAGVGLVAGIVSALVAGVVAPASACSPEGAIPSRVLAMNADGTLALEGNITARLTGLIWPDREEARARKALVETINSSLEGQEISWKPAATPDRWGIVGIHLFVKEPGAAEPFWLQAGLVEKGLAPIWPDGIAGACLKTLELHERRAFTLRRGYWAARAQAQRIADIRRDPDGAAGRRLSLVIDVASVRPWRNLHFINRMGEEARGRQRLIGIAIPNAVVSELTKQGENPRDWGGQRVIIRVVVPPEGLTRLRLEQRDRMFKIGPSARGEPTRL